MPRGAAEVLATGRREEVAARARRRRPGAARRPGRRRAGRARRPDARHRADRGGRVHEPALRRDPRDRDQADPVVEQVAQRVDRQLPRLVVGDDLDVAHRCCRATCRKAITLLAYSARDVRIRSPAVNDARQRVERHVPRAGRVLDQRDLVGARHRAARPPSRRPPPTARATASAAAYPPMRASSSRCSMTVSTTTRGGSAAPALLRWTTSRQPGVSARTAATSINGVAQEADVRCAARQSSQSSV